MMVNMSELNYLTINLGGNPISSLYPLEKGLCLYNKLNYLDLKL